MNLQAILEINVETGNMHFGNKVKFIHIHLEPFLVVVVMVVVIMGQFTLLVVGDKGISDKFAGTVGVQIVGHVVALVLHVVTEFVEGRGTDHVALTINLPGDGSVLGADLVVAAGTGGRSSVVGDVLAVLAVLDPSSHHIGVVIGFVIDNGEDLALDTDIIGNLLLGQRQNSVHVDVAKDSIVEGSLVLVHVSARSNGRVGPVNLVGLTDFHSDAVLPLVLGGEFRISSVIVVATEAIANVFVPKAARGSRNVTMGTISVLIVLSDGVVFGSQVPVDVDGAQTGLVVRLRVGLVSDIHQTFVTLGDIGASLGTWTLEVNTIDVSEVEFFSIAKVLTLREDGWDFFVGFGVLRCHDGG